MTAAKPSKVLMSVAATSPGRPRGAMWLTPESALILTLLLVVLYLSLTTSKFLTPGNLENVARQTAVLAILAVGQTLVVIARGYDLTVGSLLAFTSVIGATVAAAQGTIAGLIVFLLIGTLAGLLNGVLIARLALAPLVVTLGGLSFYRGLSIWITDGRSVTGLPSDFAVIGASGIGYIPYATLLAAVVVGAGLILLHGTRLGVYVYAIGSNPRTAMLSGVPVRAITTILYILSGGLAGLAGFVLTARVNTGQPLLGVGTELDVLAAVFIGGVSFQGGKGNLLGVVVGVILLVVAQNGFNLLGFSGFFQGLVAGVVLLAAVSLQRLLRGGDVD